MIGKISVFFFFALSSITAVFGQQIGMTRTDVQAYQRNQGYEVRSGSFTSKENKDGDIVSFKSGIGNFEFVFNGKGKCYSILFVPEDSDASKKYIKDLNKKFLQINDYKWTGMENKIFVEIKSCF